MALALYASILPRAEGALNTNCPSWGGPSGTHSTILVAAVLPEAGS